VPDNIRRIIGLVEVWKSWGMADSRLARKVYFKINADIEGELT